MKRTENNEIDLLLRAFAWGEGALSVVSEDNSAMHLDADELNSYAEQALPAAARARYTSHLAECANCRKIVSELMSASGANVTEHWKSQKASAGLRQKLAALFSPGVLRFAVPALALVALIAVGLVALRQPTEPQFVAQNQPTAASGDARLEAAQVSSPAGPSNTSAATEKPRSPETRPDAGQAETQTRKGDQSQTSKLETTPDSLAVISDKDAPAGKAAGAVAQPSYAPEPAAAPPPQPQKTHTESPYEVNARRNKEAEKKNERAREQEGARAQRDDNPNQVAVPRSQRSAITVQSKEKLRTGEAKRAGDVGAKTSDDEADIRIVSGRRFRRQAGVWIDTAYQSSSATITVARGSEQFRALVADEPGIRSIAAQLPGEVVVVWRGKAYRIR